MEVILSILIPSTPAHKDCVEKLVSSLISQGNFPDVEILEDRTFPLVIGTKRNNMLQKARGKYCVFIDADDTISANYVSKILEACYLNPDCIGLNGTISFNGIGLKDWFISKEYGSWYQNWEGYFRTPNHISPVRRELALQAGFPEIAFGEDAEYSRRLLPLLKTEIVISEKLYHYDYWEK